MVNSLKKCKCGTPCFGQIVDLFRLIVYQCMHLSIMAVIKERSGFIIHITPENVCQ